MTLQRYRLYYYDHKTGWQTNAQSVQDGFGQWCRAEDVLKLEAELERCKRAVEWLCGCLDIETSTWREFHRDAPQFDDLIKPAAGGDGK